jgi:phospholipid-binding lipoprotein MlaA
VNTRSLPIGGWRQAGMGLMLALVMLLQGGCAVLRSPMSEAAQAAQLPEPQANPADPWERFNRSVFSFNDVIDRHVLIPIARVYLKVVPEPVSRAFANMVSNVGDAWSVVNHVLQGKPRQATEMGMRFSVNTVLGLGGVLDIASEMGLERQSEDFGQTLGVWGVPTGPYLVIPLLGPSDVRDGLALPLDRTVSLANLSGEAANKYSLTFIELVHTRSRLLNASSVLDQVALDRYSFVRDSFLARRRSAVFDGNPPEEDEDEWPPAQEAAAAFRPK